MLDTSFVIRLLTRDPLPLFQSASAFLGQRAEGMPGHMVSDLVLAETYYALRHHYGFPKADALAVLLALSRHPAIAVSPHALGTLATPQLSTAKPGFVDRLIHGDSEANGATLVTFEKSARKLPNTIVLE
jgi:predicted nucleic-acid-binding protein